MTLGRAIGESPKQPKIVVGSQQISGVGLSMNSSNIIEYGPVRAIGIACVAKNENQEFSRLWSEKLMPRTSEIKRTKNSAAFGVCRCVPGRTDGAFEYLAVVEVTSDATIPVGMVDYVIPKCHYLVVEVANLSEVMKGWEEAMSLATDLDDWVPYCGPNGCDCATAASFEYYPADFRIDGPFQIYIPLKSI